MKLRSSSRISGTEALAFLIDNHLISKRNEGVAFYLTGVPVILDSQQVGQNLMNHVSYSVHFTVNNASAFQDLNTKVVRQYLSTRTGPMSSTGLSQVEYFQ